MFKLFCYFLSLFYWERQPIEKIRTMQLAKFKKMFEYARKHSKFYHDVYEKAGVLDLEIRTWEDVEKVPIVNKEMMRTVSTEDILTCPPDEKKLNFYTTSGSSGTPFKVGYAKWVDYSAHVRFVFMLMKYGYTPFKSITFIHRFYQSSKFNIEEDIGLIKRIQKYFGIFDRDIISVFEKPEVVIQHLRNKSPFAIWSTPSAILMVARELEQRNERLNIPLLILISEPSTPDQLQIFKERICLNYVDDYGCMELPTMGYGYNQNDYKQLLPSFVMAEVKNQHDIEDVKMGDFVVTNLINTAMPFIRFDLGDCVGILDDTDFPTKRIGKVFGRCDDILNVNGQDIFFHHIYQIFHDFIKVKQYKLYQHKTGELEFQMVLKESISEVEAIQEAQNRWNNHYANIPVKIVIKSELPINPKTGKFKVIEKEQ